MASLDLPLGMYTLRARLAPVFVAALPIAFGVVAVYSGNLNWWSPFWAILTMFGGMLLIAELGRDAGKRKEPQLFQSWGGKPTTQMLRRTHPANSAIRNRYIARLQDIDPSIQIPTEVNEREDPEIADDLYDAAVHVLRERTRDRKRFPLVFQALCDYGFRRNLWGLKPYGLVVAGVGAAAAGATVFMRYTSDAQTIDPAAIAAFALNSVMVTLWIFVICPDWVKVAAFSYSERLLASTEQLSNSP